MKKIFFALFVLVLCVFNAYGDIVDKRRKEIQSNLWANSKKIIAQLKAIGIELTAKKEVVCITTRDGICLSTNIFYPNESLHSSPYNVLFADTPYGKDLLDRDAEVANAEGWVFMGQDQRGRYNSTGNYSFWRTQGNDTMDTIEYINSQNWSSNKIEVIGISADCLAQYADITGVTQFPVGSQLFERYYKDFSQILFGQFFLGNGMGYQTVYQGGSYRQGLITGWLDDLHEKDTVTTVLENENFNIEYWKYLTGQLNNQWYYVNISALHFAGWYDIFGNYQIETVMYLNSSGPAPANGNQILIVDPGGHCLIGAIPWINDGRGWELVEIYGIPAAQGAFNAPNISEWNIHDYFPFNVYFYVLGPSIAEEGLYWVQASGFPEYIPTYWYINDNNMLSKSNQSTSNSQTYLYNPMDPVKTWGGNNLIIQPCGPQNQNHVEDGRKDVLKYNSTVLTENIAIVGPIWVNLFVSSDAVDTDFVVKIVDVFPDGTRMLVQDGIYRMRWRDAQPYYPELLSFNYDNALESKMMQNGAIYNISVQVGHMSYVFNKNHKIGLSITSSNYPRFSINYNSGNNVINNSTGYKYANNVIHYGGMYNANIELPVVDLKWIQDRKVDWVAFDKMKAAKFEKYGR